MMHHQDEAASAREKRREKIRALAASACAGGQERQRQQEATHQADQEQLRAQRPLEYGVLLTAVGGLAVRFAEDGFEFLEDYALRLDHVEAIFAPTDSSNEHIRVLFQPIGGATISSGTTLEARLDLEVAEEGLLWRVSGLVADKPRVSSFEAASEILLKLTDITQHMIKQVANR